MNKNNLTTHVETKASSLPEQLEELVKAGVIDFKEPIRHNVPICPKVIISEQGENK